MKKILILSDSFSEYMCASSFGVLKSTIDKDIGEIVLLEEKHASYEVSIIKDIFPVTLAKSLTEGIEMSDYVLTLAGDVRKYDFRDFIDSKTFIECCNPWSYDKNMQSFSLNNSERVFYKKSPVILILSFSRCSQIVNAELLIHSIFRKHGIPIYEDFLPFTKEFLREIGFENKIQNMDGILVKTVFMDRSSLKSKPLSEILHCFEDINPNYTIFCLDSDQNTYMSDMAAYRRIFGKEPDKITVSSFFDYSIERLSFKVNNSFYRSGKDLQDVFKSDGNILYENIMARFSLPNDVYIL